METLASLRLGILAIFWLPTLGVGLYLLSLATYRLLLSPLAKFPGPRLAALTRKYESYYEAVQNYEYVWKIKKLHQKYGETSTFLPRLSLLDFRLHCQAQGYKAEFAHPWNSGPIIRISPHELHIDDADFFDQLNSFQGKWNKDPYTAHQFANPGSLVGTLDHDIHRRRRAAVLPFFSKQKIYALEPVITATVEKLCDKLQDYRKNGSPVPIRNAFHCFAADVVAEYCFAESGGLLDTPDFGLTHMQEHAQGLKAGLRARYLPSWYLPVVRGAPEWIRASIDPAAKHFEVWHRVSLNALDKWLTYHSKEL